MTTTVVHARIETMRHGAPPAESVAWVDGRIVAVGCRADVLGAVRGPTQTFELGERSVTPGFIDAHHHAGIAAVYGGRLTLSPPGVTDISSLQAALASAAAQTPSDRWVVAVDWSELRLREGRAPTRAELDEAVPHHPLFAMHYSCHRAVANSLGLERAGISRHTPEPSGGSIQRGRKGEPTGLLIERAMSVVELLARADLLAKGAAEIVARLGAHDSAALAVGITRLVDAAVPLDLMAVYEAAHQRGLARIPTTLMPVSVRGWLEEPLDVLVQERFALRAKTLSLGPVKLVFDGAHECAMCLSVWQSLAVSFRAAAIALRQGSFDTIRTMLAMTPRLEGGKLRTGVLLYKRREATETIARALEREYPTAVHAEGNAAIDQVLEAYTAAGSRLHAYGQARIEHGFFLTPQHIEQIAGLGLGVVTQPAFLTLPELAHAPEIPGVRIMPLRALVDAQVSLVGSSDAPVASFDPMLGIRRAMRRPQLDPDQAITLSEALALYTRNAAEVIGCSKECGTLEVGKRADLLVFDRALDETSVTDAKVTATVLGGELVSGALGGTLAENASGG